MQRKHDCRTLFFIEVGLEHVKAEATAIVLLAEHSATAIGSASCLGSEGIRSALYCVRQVPTCKDKIPPVFGGGSLHP